jgi:hypothetical protein
LATQQTNLDTLLFCSDLRHHRFLNTDPGPCFASSVLLGSRFWMAKDAAAEIWQENRRRVANKLKKVDFMSFALPRHSATAVGHWIKSFFYQFLSTIECMQTIRNKHRLTSAVCMFTLGTFRSVNLIVLSLFYLYVG